MKIRKLQKIILLSVLGLCILSPIGIMLPAWFDAGDAWGEWSAQTLKDMIGYVPEGLAKYAEVWTAPLGDYTVNPNDSSLVHQSGYYIISGIFGATVSYIVMLVLSRIIIRNGK